MPSTERRIDLAAILPPVTQPLRRLVLSGGSSANAVIRHAAADVFRMRAFVAGRAAIEIS